MFITRNTYVVKRQDVKVFTWYHCVPSGTSVTPADALACCDVLSHTTARKDFRFWLEVLEVMVGRLGTLMYHCIPSSTISNADWEPRTGEKSPSYSVPPQASQ